MADPKIIRHVLTNWDIDAILDELSKASWTRTESRRIDRRVYIASERYSQQTARSTVSKQEWDQAAGADGFEHEIVDEYMDILGEVLARIMGSHVYVFHEEDGWFAGQYEDGDIKDLMAAGYKIDD